MSVMAEGKARRKRRRFTEEFKAGAVRLVLDEGKTVGAAARDLIVTEERDILKEQKTKNDQLSETVH